MDDSSKSYLDRVIFCLWGKLPYRPRLWVACNVFPGYLVPDWTVRSHMVLEPCEVCSTWRVEFTEPSGLANRHIYIEFSYTIVNIVAKLESITLPFSMEDSEYESLPTEKATVHLAAGALAGVMEHCVMYPVDCVKVRWGSILWWLLYLAKNINAFQPRFCSRQILLVFVDHMVELFLRDLQKRLLEIAWNWIMDIVSSSVSGLVHHFFSCFSPVLLRWQTTRSVFI